MEPVIQELKSSFSKLNVGKSFMMPGSEDVFIKIVGIEFEDSYCNALCISGNNAGTDFRSLLPNQQVVEVTFQLRPHIFSIT